MMEISATAQFWLWFASVWIIVICGTIANANLHARIDELEEKLEKENSK